MKIVSRVFFSLYLVTGLFSLNALGQTIPQHWFSVGFSSASNIPFGYSALGIRSQQLFPVGAFNKGGVLPPQGREITKVYWRANGTVSGASTFDALEIYLKQENIALLTTTYKAGMTLVYSTINDTLQYAGGSWFGIELQTPFPYNPNLPLICEVRTIPKSFHNMNINISSGYPGAYRNYDLNFNSVTASVVTSTIPDFGFDLRRTNAGNDIGVTAIDSPLVFCEGNQPVFARVQNFGINRVDSFTVNWSVNGVLQQAVVTSLMLDTFDGLKPSFAYVNLGSLHYFSKQKINVYAWTSMPNNKADTVMGNDSTFATKASSMHGIYKIDLSASAGSHYRNIADFADDISEYGVCGPVRAEISAGVYEGKVIFNRIRGSGKANPIEIIGDSMGMVAFNPGPVSPGLDFMMKISACNRMEFRNITLNADSTQLSLVVDINDASSNLTFRKCNFIGRLFPSNMGNYILVNCNTGGNHMNTFEECEFFGGTHGIYFKGLGQAATNNNLIIRNNLFLQQSLASIFTIYSRNTYVNNNRVYSSGMSYSSPMSSMFLYGIYLTFTYEKSEIRSNDINIEGSHGMYIYSMESTVNYRPVIANNFVRVGRNTYPSGYGLYIGNSSNLIIAHNTVASDFRDYATHSVYIQGGGNTFINNNIYEVRGLSSASCISILSPYSVFECDYNNYFTSRYLGYFVMFYPSLSSWQNATGYDLHSKTSDPGFTNLDSLRTCSDSLEGAGIPVAAVSTDFDGDARHLLSPDIGADEWVGSSAGSYEAGNDTFLCSGRSIDLGIPVSGGSFSWSNGDSTSVTTVDEEGRYIVNMTSHCGASHTDTIHVSDLTPLPSFNINTNYHTVELQNTSVNMDSNMWVIEGSPADTFYSEDLIHLFDGNGPYRIDLHIYNKCDSAVSSEIWTGSVGMAEENEGEDILIYPNPATDVITIELKGGSGNSMVDLINVISGREYKYTCIESLKNSYITLDVS